MAWPGVNKLKPVRTRRRTRTGIVVIQLSAALVDRFPALLEAKLVDFCGEK